MCGAFRMYKKPSLISKYLRRRLVGCIYKAFARVDIRIRLLFFFCRVSLKNV